jgi:bifunctional DNA-binding transcriptional regulator/antitoxin component of YhaV-PrlF toxin-antitoxin module
LIIVYVLLSKIIKKMGYKVKVQRVDRGKTKSFYINFPAALAEAGEINKGEEMEWIIQDKDTYILKRIKKASI